MDTDNLERGGKEEFREVDAVPIEEAMAEVGGSGESRLLPRYMTSGSQRGQMVISGYLSIEDNGREIARIGKLRERRTTE